MSLTNDLSKLASVANTINTVGSNGQILTSNGTSSYWANAAAGGAATGTVTPAPYVNSAIAATTGNGTTATVTYYGAYAPLVGSTVTIRDVTPTSYNGTWTVTSTATGNSTSNVSFSSTANGSMTVAGTLYTSPAGYLFCDGSIYTRSAYPNLATIIGNPIMLSSATSLASCGGNIYPFITSNGASVAAMIVTSAFFTQTSASAGANAFSITTNGTSVTTTISGWTPSTTGASNGSFHMTGVYYDYCSGGTAAYQYSTSFTSGWTKGSVPWGNTGGDSNILLYGGTGNVFLMSQRGFVTSTTMLYSSTNGTSWSACTFTGLSNSYITAGAAYSGGVVVSTVSLSGPQKIWYSASGTGTYTDITSSFTFPVNSNNTNYCGISYSNGKFILTIYALPANGGTSIYTSTTGASGTWTLQGKNVASGSVTPYFPVRWNGSVYQASTSYSYDLITWGTSYSANLGTAINNNTHYPVGTKFLSYYNGAAYSFDHNGYNSSTQFPLPYYYTGYLNSGAANYTSGGGGPLGYFIKT
jgi:hypothetical protein